MGQPPGPKTKTTISKIKTKAGSSSSSNNPSSARVRPSSSSKRNPLLSNASSWYHSCSSSSSSSSALRSSAVEEATEAVASDGLPEFGSDGMYHITNEEEYKALLDANPDKLIIMKVFAPWCRACKGLEPKFKALSRHDKYSNLPIVWASFNMLGNTAFVKSIGVLAVPTVQVYAGNG